MKYIQSHRNVLVAGLLTIAALVLCGTARAEQPSEPNKCEQAEAAFETCTNDKCSSEAAAVKANCPSVSVAPAASAPATGKPDFSTEKGCKANGGKWVEVNILDKKGSPTGKTRFRCFGIGERLSLLEDALKKKQQEDLTPEEVTAVRELLKKKPEAASKEPPEGMAELCPPIDNRPEASWRDRCLVAAAEYRRQLQASKPSSTSEEDHDLLAKVVNHVNGIEKGTIPVPPFGYRPRMMLGLTFTLHTTGTPEDQRLLWISGFEANYMPPLTRGLSLSILGGIGVGSHRSTGDSVVVTGAFGFCGPLGTDDLIWHMFLYGEHWNRIQGISTDFVGAGPEVVWTPGASTRRAYQGLSVHSRADGQTTRLWEPWTVFPAFVPYVAFRLIGGATLTRAPSYKMVDTWEPIVAGSLGVAF